MAKNFLDQNGLAYFWTYIKSFFVPSTRTINNKPLSSDVILTAKDLNAIADPQIKQDGQILCYDGENQAWKAINFEPGGVQSIEEGTVDGTIRVNGATNVSVHGLKGAAYKDVSDFTLASSVGAANGLCPLDSASKVDASYLPSYVDDVVECYIVGSTPFASDWLSETAGGAPLTPEDGKIYIILSTGDYLNFQYRWGGTIYVKISDSGVSSMTNAEIDEILNS